MGSLSSSTWPESGVSSPAMMRSSVLLPPPEGPISTSACVSPKSACTASSTTRPANDFATCSRRSFIGSAASWRRRRGRPHVDGLGKQFKAHRLGEGHGGLILRQRAKLYDPPPRHGASHGGNHGGPAKALASEFR